MISAMAIFTANDTLMKQAAAELPTMQVVAMRGAAASVVMLAIIVAFGETSSLRRLADVRMTARSVVEFASIGFFITALANFPIADVIAIAQVAPLIAVPAAALIYGDRVTPLMGALCLVGFVGALLVTQPGAAGFDPLILTAFGTALAQVTRDLLQRRIDTAIPASLVAFSTCLVVALIAAGAAMVQGLRAPSAWASLLLLGAGLALAFGHLLLVMAFRAAPISVVAPFGYSATLWAVISGYVVFGDRLDAATLLGIATLVVSGILLARARKPPSSP